MDEHDIIFDTYNIKREIKYTLYEGQPLTFGRQHILNNGRKRLADNPEIIKYAVENHEKAYWDGLTHKGNIRERLYCSGADPCRSDMYVAVVVDYESEKEGKIITAWQTHTITDSDGDITYVKS